MLSDLANCDTRTQSWILSSTPARTRPRTHQRRPFAIERNRNPFRCVTVEGEVHQLCLQYTTNCQPRAIPSQENTHHGSTEGPTTKPETSSSSAGNGKHHTCQQAITTIQDETHKRHQRLPFSIGRNRTLACWKRWQGNPQLCPQLHLRCQPWAPRLWNTFNGLIHHHHKHRTSISRNSGLIQPFKPEQKRPTKTHDSLTQHLGDSGRPLQHTDDSDASAVKCKHSEHNMKHISLNLKKDHFIVCLLVTQKVAICRIFPRHDSIVTKRP